MGDVMIGRLVNEALTDLPPQYLWGNMLPLLKQNDFNLINLEAALTTHTHAVPKVFNFKADPSKVKSLIEGHITVANLANNHILDFDVPGLQETLQTLDRAHIKHVGAGQTLAEAKKPMILEKEGVKIAILGCTDNEPSWDANDQKPGVFYVEVGKGAALKKEIAHLKSQVDVVILSMHWGPNMRDRPTPEFIAFAHEMVDAGAHIFHGHSAHVFQGVEIYNGGLILYDTGDFVDDYAVDLKLRNDRSFLFVVEIDKRGFQTLTLYPTFISNCQVNLAPEKEAKDAMKKMIQLSAEMRTDFLTGRGALILRYLRS